MSCDLETSIPDWIIEHPETTRVFAQLGLDTSCAGKSLEWVVVGEGLSPPEVLQLLQLAIDEHARKNSKS